MSNFSIHPAEYENVIYETSEHAYQAAKTIIPSERFNILNLSTPGKAKRVGQTVTMREHWDKIKDHIMTHILISKFSDPILMGELKDTGNAILIEGNHWHDNYWGDCSCDKCSNKKGKNKLGIILMNIRDDRLI